MPELPEVETVKNGLIKKVKNKTIKGVRVLYNGIIDYPDVKLFIEELSNKEIKDIKRRGKYLIFDLDDYYLLSHLRMEGKYFIKNKDDIVSKHDHVIFNLDDGTQLRYNDTRKFGRMYLCKKDEIDKSPISLLGREPEDLTLEYLKVKLNRKKPIKTLLLDQSIIAGIGNIYADEILFASRINPKINGSSLTNKNIKDIIIYTQRILGEAIKAGGTTIHTYTAVDGITGRFQQSLLVHGIKECSSCGTKIEKIVINTRGTYYCPKCQKEK